MKLVLDEKAQQIIKDLAINMYVRESNARGGLPEVTAVIRAFISFYKLDIVLSSLRYDQETLDYDFGATTPKEGQE